MKNPLLKSILTIALLATATGVARANEKPGPVAAIDALLAEAYPANLPGAAVLVAQHNQVVLRRAYGLAQMEPARAIAPDTIFRIGSMTKQFTAVAILQLVEAGSLKLDSTIGQLLPGSPAAWQQITVEQLLRHTAGLAAGTNQPDELDKIPRTVAELLDIAGKSPAIFAPGTNWAYSNDGFIVLGAIIEKVSGQSYADYIEKHIAGPAGLKDTHCDAGDDDNPRRARGYKVDGDNKVEPANFLHMSQTFSAGALVSTVDDLWLWEKALESGRVVSKVSLEKAWTSGLLPDGRHTGYGYGWFVAQVAGHPTHEHGGAVNGFSSYQMAVDGGDLNVLLLTNREGNLTAPVNPATLSPQIAQMLLGGQPAAPVAAQADLAALAGVYQVNPAVKRQITVEGGVLFSQTTGRPKLALTAIAIDRFTTANGSTIFLFHRDASGGVTAMFSHPRVGPESLAPRVNEPFTETKPAAITLPPEVLAKLAGTYELAPGMTFTVQRTGDGLAVQVAGQPPIKMIAESPVRFRCEGVPVTITFAVATDGNVTGAAFAQGGQTMPAKRTTP